MDFGVQKRLAASVLKCSPKRVRFDTTALEDVKEAITKSDIRGLVADGIIYEVPMTGISKGRAHKILTQKRKGRRKGAGSRKGTKNARLPKKTVWMNKIRLQRHILKGLKESARIENKTYRALYNKASSGFFRSERHLKLYIQENRLLVDNTQQKMDKQVE